MTADTSINPILKRLRLRVAERKILRIIDRNCHGGRVEFRLPLAYRIDCANGRYNHDR